MDKITYTIMNEIGLDIDILGRVVDQDYDTVIYMNGKTIKANYNDNINTPIARNEVLFNPLFDAKLGKYLFGYYLKKIAELDERKFDLFYAQQDSTDNRKSYLEIRGADEVIRGKSYFSESLKIMDLLLRTAGHLDTDLSFLDNQMI